MIGLEPFSAVLLMLTCFWGPFMAIQSARRLGQGPLPMTRRRFFIQTILIQALLFGVAVMAAWRTGVPLVVAPPAAVLPWLIAVALVALGVLLLRWRWSSRTTANKFRLYSILPRTASEFPSYFVLCLAAGISEEVVYRGMLYAILAYLTGSTVAAVLIASVRAGACHPGSARRLRHLPHRARRARARALRPFAAAGDVRAHGVRRHRRVAHPAAVRAGHAGGSVE
jgi:membrane protease YdiL (CAAX protease family)